MKLSVLLVFQKIIWLSGPYCGTSSDPTIVKKSRIKQHLHENEAFLADKLYCGDWFSFITAATGQHYSLDFEEWAFNFLVNLHITLLRE